MPLRWIRPNRAAISAAVPAALLAVVLLAGTVAPVAAVSRAQYPAVASGSYGADVTALQRLLRHHGGTVAVSGRFDTATRTALIAFQRSRSLPDDGVARPATWRALVVRIAGGSTGEAVRAVQEQLVAKRNAALTVNGSFDAPTQDAVRALQRRVGLPRTGVMDGDTWRHLIWLFRRPQLGAHLCGYEINAGRSPKWGTAGAISQLEHAAQLYGRRTGSRLAVGDISLELGGDISGHSTHEVGLDVDIRPARKDGRECRWGIAYTMRSYDRAGTRALIHAIHDAAPGRVKLIYFNDPVLVGEGLVRRYPNHDAHLHVRYCEVDHPRSAYRCPNAAKQAAASESAPTPATQPLPSTGNAGLPVRGSSPVARPFWTA